VSLTTEIKLEVQRMIREGRKSDAIQFLSQRLNIPYAQAQTLGDAAEIELTLQQGSEIIPGNNTHRSAELSMEIKTLLREGKKIDAVKLVREREKVSLKEALSRVEAIESLINPNFKPTAFGDSSKNPFNLFGKIFAGVGVLITAIALLIFYLKQDTVSRSEIREGYVIDLEYSGNSTAPRIEYEWNGSKRIFTSSVYTHPPAYEVGERVELFVNVKDPADVVINSFTGRWLAVIIVGGIGLFFFAFGLLFTFISGKF
jgi:ribosomal protein L7/L12